MAGPRSRCTDAAFRNDWAPVITPIFQSTTFVNPVGGDEEVLYTRYGNNPNQVDLGRKYSALEGAEDAVFVSSGMAATALAHLAILRPGDHLLASKWIYGGTRKLFDEEFGRLGIGVSYADPVQPRHWRKMLRKNTRALFLESRPIRSSGAGPGRSSGGAQFGSRS
jgi:cystathionine beta-lyase/cystathionine gamma-synthase